MCLCNVTVYTYSCIETHTLTNVYMYVRIHSFILNIYIAPLQGNYSEARHTYMYVMYDMYVYIRMYVCMYVYMYVRIYVYLYIRIMNMYCTCIHNYTYAHYVP